LEWSGEAEVSDGGCTETGAVNNIVGPCSGQFSFLSATLVLEKLGGTIADPVQTINFQPSQFGSVVSVTRGGLNPSQWTGVVSSAFDAVRGTIPQTIYDANGSFPPPPSQAYFSLVFVGSFAQLIWFQNDPGDPILPQSGVNLPIVGSGSIQYGLCYLAGSGDHFIGINRCGLSNANNAQGATLNISVVPEPEAYMMALASLGVLGVAGTISRRRKAEP
jgi:hypothetical protein